MRNSLPDTVYYLTDRTGHPVKQGLYRSLAAVRGILTRIGNHRRWHNERPVTVHTVEPSTFHIWEGTITWKKIEKATR